MGTPVTRKEKINRLKRSPANNYIAEIFFEELQFILGEDLQDQVMVICHGMNTRTQSYFECLCPLCIHLEFIQGDRHIASGP